MITIDNALKLLEMGYAPEEIKKLDTSETGSLGEPDTKNVPGEPVPEPVPEPVTVPDQPDQQVMDMIKALTNNVDKLSRQMSQLAMRDITQPNPTRVTAEDILQQMLVPKKGEN